jgi:DNA-binding NarL/FixJ family response regulator
MYEPLGDEAVKELDDATIRVMVVDDQRMFAESVARILSDEGDIEVVGHATTAQAAIDLQARDVADVVVMDQNLPDTNGIMAARQLRSTSRNTRVVLITGEDRSGLVLDAMEAGCLGYVTKDKAASELVDAVRAAYRGVTTVAGDALTKALAVRRHQPNGGGLSPREQEVLALMARGERTTEIAESLFVSRNTVRTHVQNVLSKLGAHSMLEAVAVARDRGLI